MVADPAAGGVGEEGRRVGEAAEGVGLEIVKLVRSLSDWRDMLNDEKKGVVR